MRRIAAAFLCLFAFAAHADYLPAPVGAGNLSGLMYASTCQVSVNSSTPTSTFCPNATDSTSVARRTYPANSLTIGKAFYIVGGGTYSVPTGNTLSADIILKVGSATVVSITTPAAPFGTNQGVEFYAICSVRTTTTINCQGSFKFILAGGGTPIGFSQTATFDPTVADVIDVTGDWNGTTTTHVCTVTQAILMALN